MKQPRKQPRRTPTLGQTLRTAREEAGLPKLQLEAMTGVGRMSIARLEDDWYRHPPPDDLVRLARALELNVTDLFLLARVPLPDRAASLEVMLRKGYGVSDAEVPELKQEIERLIAKHVRQTEQEDNQHEGGGRNDKQED